jgi:hypothetical protein
VGLVTKSDNQQFEISYKHGVILATADFDWDAEIRTQFLKIHIYPEYVP